MSKINEIKDFWDLTAKTYTDYFGLEDEFLDDINNFIDSTKQGGVVLDLGCGGGIYY
jgi:hypothetical protein